MKKSISINLQGLLFHIEEDGYDVLRRYLAEVKQHFSAYAGHEEIVADIEGRIAELFASRLTPGKQVITLEDVLAVTAQLGRVSEFELPDDEDAPAGTASGRAAAFAGSTAAGQAAAGDPAEPRRLFRDEANKKIAGVAAGLGHYFNTNPLWFRLAFVLLAALNTRLLGDWDRHIHINFGGISLLTYLILWVVMPKRVGLPVAGGVDARGPGAGRKLFRDTQAGSVGGVAAGLAWYLKLDVTLVRVLFVVLTLAGGGGLLLYLILWIVVPEARSLTDQLEMRGEDVTLSNIASSASADPIGAGRARVVQDNLSSIGSSVAPIFRFLFTLVAWFAGFILLCISVALLVATGAVLGTVLGAFPDVDWVQTGDIPVHLLRSTLPAWGLAAGFVAALIPTIGLLGLAVRLFTKRPLLPASARLSLFGIWLLSLIGVAAAVGRMKADFRERATISTVQTLGEPTTPVIILDALDQDDSDLLRPERLTIAAADSGQPLALTVRVQANGPTVAAAREAAAQVEYRAERADSVVSLPSTFRFKSDAAWRKQEVELRLALPTAGVRYRLTEAFANSLEDDVLASRYRYDGKLDQRLWAVANGRFKLVSGPDGSGEADESSEDGDHADFDLNINGERIRIDLDGDDSRGFRLQEPATGGARRSWDLTNFTKLDVSGAYQVRVRRGDAFRVTAHGAQRGLDEVRVVVDGETLQIESEKKFRISGFGGLNRERARVLFEVEMPRLDGLDISGAARADVRGFASAGEMNIDQSGASWLTLATDSAPLRLDVSGASHTQLIGTAPTLTAELSGACELRARRLNADEVTLDASGASRATVTARRELRAEANGVSHIIYFGKPENVDTDANGASSVKRGNANEDESKDEPTTDEDSEATEPDA